jgi:glutaredoxin
MDRMVKSKERIPLRQRIAVTAAIWAVLLIAHGAHADPPVQTRHVAIEIYVRSGEPASETALRVVTEFLKRRTGVSLRVQDLDGPRGEELQQRLGQIAKFYATDSSRLPIIYGCNILISGEADASRLTARLAEMLRIDVFSRAGCPRCREAEAYLERLRRIYPGFEIRIRDIGRDAQARRELNQLVQKHRQAAASVPVIHLCHQLIVGFDSPGTTGKRMEAVLNHWTHPAREPPAARPSDTGMSGFPGPSRVLHAGMFAWNMNGVAVSSFAGDVSRPENDDEPPLLPLPPRPLPEEPDDLLPYDDDGDVPLPHDPGFEHDRQAIALPLFGNLQVNEIGMPLFTIAVGLVDGFNPCAMWVLLFLLSILVNLKSRARILAVAGTFVFISGLAYFLFMAAWMNVFMMIGLLRPVQIVLAVVAILIGSIHIKDFFAFKQGISLSIPESAKPGIYARVRRIVTAENLTGAIFGAAILAVLVNLVELLCTAGLPAMYTAILTMQEYPVWKNYAYLLLYNVAYMFDDAVMVALVVITLGKRKMQERHGRWLKLISGAAIALLGLVMLFRPQWLMT